MPVRLDIGPPTAAPWIPTRLMEPQSSAPMCSAATSPTAKRRRGTSPVGFDQTISLMAKTRDELNPEPALVLLMFEITTQEIERHILQRTLFL